MSKKEIIQDLIKRTIKCPSDMTDKDIINLYNEVQNVFKSKDYTEAEKKLLHDKGQIESLAMLYDGIKK